MKLKKLIVQGFKSFKDRTTIHFDQGITGIVGPNGCGKSNIVDALFWVMGEQSAKHLRGSSMKDVIFSGSSRYSPAAFAEATLVLENSEGKHIHIGNKVSSPSEIQLTRKLYRNGETEYRINGHPARLKDIQEVFMDTGAGAKSYSIIAQGEINRLVQAKPEERRSMIEEVAGITKFKLRKRESMRKIEQTESNLSRLQDLKAEIEKNLKTLQKQAEKAEKARNLKEKIKRNELVVNAHKVFELLRDFRQAKSLINERRLEIENNTSEKDRLEIGLEEERYQKEQKSEKIEELQKEFNQVSKELAAAEERFSYLCQSLTDKEEQIAGRQKEIEEIEQEYSDREEKLKELEAKLEEMREGPGEDEEFSEREERVENLKEELELKSSQLTELQEQEREKKEALQSLEQEIFRNNSKLEEYAGNLQDMSEEIEELEKQYSSVSQQIANEREQVKEAETRVEELTTKEKAQAEALATKTEESKEQDRLASDKSRELIQKESRLGSLKEVRDSMEGAKEGAQEFLGSEKGEGFELLGNLIQCEKEYTPSVQNLLSPFVDSLLKTGGDTTSLFNWEEAADNKAFDYLVTEKAQETSAETRERLGLYNLGEVKPLSEIVSTRETPAGMESFLSGFFVVENLNQEILEKMNTEIRFRALATKDGKAVLRNVEGTLLYSSIQEGESQGVVSRNNAIEELEAEIETLSGENEELAQKGETLNQEVETQQAELQQTRQELSDARADYAAKKSALDSRVEGMESGNSRLEILKKRHSEISKSRLELLEGEEGLTKKKEDLDQEIADLAERREEVSEALEDLKSTYQQEKEELVQKQVERDSYQERLNNMESQVNDVREQLEKMTQKKAAHQERVTQAREEIEKIQKEVEELETSNQDKASTLREKEEVLGDLKDDLSQLLTGMQEREDKVKDLSQKINKAEKEVVEAETKIETAIKEEEEITRNIFEKYRVDLRSALTQYLEYEENEHEGLTDLSSMYVMETENGQEEIVPEAYEFNRRYGQDLKDCEVKLRSYKQEYNRLGEINWQAIEDYERQKLRFDFLQQQETELKESLEDLQTAIEHIDQKSRERFRVAFEEVNQRFEKVFPIIFGGGSAQLKVVGDLEDPQCGVDIIAQPPGKKMQNINLMSGGEKALTAVSLIFSIFLVKPSPFCLLDEVDAPLDDANVGRFNELLREMSEDSQFILITHNKKTMELNDTLYGVTMQEAGVSKAVSVQLH